MISPPGRQYFSAWVTRFWMTVVKRKGLAVTFGGKVSLHPLKQLLFVFNDQYFHKQKIQSFSRPLREMQAFI